MEKRKAQWIREDIIEKNTKVYMEEDAAFRALLGGIGTGNISLNANGAFCDFEVMNHSDKGLKIPYTFFSLWCRGEGEKPGAYVLETKPTEINTMAGGYPSGCLYGLPRMDSCTIRTRYPFYEYEFHKKNLPLDIRMEAYTPFIPLDVKDSGIPGFRISYTVTNRSEKRMDVSVCGSLYNFTGMQFYDGYTNLKQDGEPRNRMMFENGLTGIFFDNPAVDSGELHYGTLALATPEAEPTYRFCWLQGRWWDGAEDFWRDFREDGALAESPAPEASAPNSGNGPARKAGSLCVSGRLEPGESRRFRFYLTWSFPNRPGWWPEGYLVRTAKREGERIWKNAYSNYWKDAWEEALYLWINREFLEGKSRDFADALYSTTLDADVIESLVMSITTLRSCTCFCTADGRFYGWEGCNEHAGSCAGTCTHVWNYAQTVAYLFPELERSARRTEFLDETDGEGCMAFRARTRLDGKRWMLFPAADGQPGAILRVYREWKLSGDDGFLREVWDKVAEAMDFSIRNWDSDGDFVMDSRQHNTYDIEFYGITSMTNSIFFAVLEACARMAEYLGEEERAAKWREGWKKGSRKMDSLLFNGLWYEQKPDGDIDDYKYQYGSGCLADQIIGQTFAHLCGLGYILPEDHVKSAAEQIYRNNFLEELGDHESVQRTYVFPDEGGLILCSWPKGGRPKLPFVYSDEVWTGIEYQVATELIYEGFLDEAMEIVHAIRRRHDGKRRSPYNEIECGFHYARSMAAWGLLIALTG